MTSIRLTLLILSLSFVTLSVLPTSHASGSKSVAVTFTKDIAPGAERERISACWTASSDVNLTALMPHMHTRGAAMQIEAVYPDGHKEMVLNVPRYDFAWQTGYVLQQPLHLPKGTTLLVTGWFDNSAKNKFNPDPTKAVRWGDPTYDEMLACFIDYTSLANASIASRD